MTAVPSQFIDRSQDAPSLAHLEALVGRLSDADLARPLDDGWTISGVLAHLAFWDRRAAYLVQQWQGGRKPSSADDIADVDVVNEAAKPQWLALQPRAAANEALAAARAADAALDGTSADLIKQIVAAGPTISLARSHHRLEHLDQIEQALGA